MSALWAVVPAGCRSTFIFVGRGIRASFSSQETELPLHMPVGIYNRVLTHSEKEAYYTAIRICRQNFDLTICKIVEIGILYGYFGDDI